MRVHHDMTLREWLRGMRDERKVALLAIYDEYRDLFHLAPGSSHNHQAWPGGYADHIAECLRANDLLYGVLDGVVVDGLSRPLPFTQDQATIALFFHDIEKPWRYGPEDRDDRQTYLIAAEDIMRETQLPPARAWEKVKWTILADLMERFNFDLGDEELNAIKYTHGEGDSHRKDKRVQKPLAAHVHHCDNTSARIWFDQGEGLG